MVLVYNSVISTLKNINRLIFTMKSLSVYCDRTLFDIAYVLRNICKVKTKYL
jgi:hypothetical protein